MKTTYVCIFLLMTGLAVVAAGIVKANRSETVSMVAAASGMTCHDDDDCGDRGRCRNDKCVCDKGYITWKKSGPCSYKQENKLTSFLISFFVGVLGIDWFVLSKGSARYIVTGVVKLILSCGCCANICSFLGQVFKEIEERLCVCLSIILFSCGSGVWYLVDLIRILADAFPDGNGAPLEPW